MTLDGVGMTPNEFLPWIIAVVGLSVIAYIYVCRRENNTPSRLLWLLLLISVPILSSIAAFLYYWLLQPVLQKREQKAP